MNYSTADFVERVEIRENILTKSQRLAPGIDNRNDMICIRNKPMFLNKVKRLGFVTIKTSH